MLGEIDVGLSHHPAGSTDWLIADVQRGGFVLHLVPRARIEAEEFGPQITRTFVTGMDELEHGGMSPPYLSESGLKGARQFVRLVGHEGISGIRLANGGVAAELTANASANVEQLIRVGRESIGSVEGRFETISLRGKPRFVVYHAQTRKAVVCHMDGEKLLEQAKHALGRRVYMAGVVQYNLRGEPSRVNVERIRVLRERKDLPSPGQLTGIDPAYTGDFSTDGYLRSIRG
jgi:hypothetical protein